MTASCNKLTKRIFSNDKCGIWIRITVVKIFFPERKNAWNMFYLINFQEKENWVHNGAPCYVMHNSKTYVICKYLAMENVKSSVYHIQCWNLTFSTYALENKIKILVKFKFVSTIKSSLCSLSSEKQWHCKGYEQYLFFPNTTDKNKLLG